MRPQKLAEKALDAEAFNSPDFGFPRRALSWGFSHLGDPGIGSLQAIGEKALSPSASLAIDVNAVRRNAFRDYDNAWNMSAPESSNRWDTETRSGLIWVCHNPSPFWRCRQRKGNQYHRHQPVLQSAEKIPTRHASPR